MISKMFLLLLIFFIDNIIPVISSTQIACYVMCVQYVQKQPPEVFFKKDVLKNFANFTGKHPCRGLFFNNVTGLKACSFTPSLQLHHSSATEDSSTVKEQELTKHCFLPHRFSTESLQYQYWKARKYSILTVIELGPPVSEFSTESKQFMPPLILNTNFRKRESKIGYP